MSEWRPEGGWENPYTSSLDVFNGVTHGGAYEAGADAMLAGVKKTGSHALWVTSKGPGEYGTWVFIPDEKA